MIKAVFYKNKKLQIISLMLFFTGLFFVFNVSLAAAPSAS